MRRPSVDIAERSEHAHPLAKRLWSQLRTRSEADRRLVYEALQLRLEPNQTSANQQIAIAALQRFDGLRRSARTRSADPSDPSQGVPQWAQAGPSRRRYNTFRDDQPDSKAWPSSQLIVNAFGYQWGEALKAAGLAVAPDVLAMRRTTLPDPYTKPELQEIVCSWIATVDGDDPERPLTQGDFFVWLERQRRDPDSKLKRWPSRPTVRKRLGCWMTTLVELGQAHRHPSIAVAHVRCGGHSEERRAWAERAVAAVDLGALPERKSVRSRGSGYTLEELEGWMRRLTVGLTTEDAATMTMAQWELLRRSFLLRLLAEQKRIVDVPSDVRFVSEPTIRSWPHAKIMAGIAEIDDVAVTTTRNEAYEDSELEDALIEVARELGHLPSKAEYRRERERILERRREAEPWTHLPCDNTLRLRLGKQRMHWTEVLEVVCARHPELLTLSERNQQRQSEHRTADGRDGASDATATPRGGAGK